MNPITKLFNIQYPIIQGGMVWVSGAKLAAAVSNAGGLGLIGAASMPPEVLEAQLVKANELTDRPFGVNLPLLYSKAEEQINLCLKYGVKIFFTSAGSPKKWTPYLKDKGAVVVHVTSSPELALKCEQAGVDAIVAEGFEAGGHNGRDEITTLTLIPQVVDAVSIPVIAAGGIADGRGMAAAFCLGAKGIQMGTRFVACTESSAHENFISKIIEAGPGDTKLMMKDIVPVRLLKNKFYYEVEELELQHASKDERIKHLGKGRSKAMHSGDMEDGELEIGQISGIIRETLSAQEIINQTILQFKQSAACIEF